MSTANDSSPGGMEFGIAPFTHQDRIARPIFDIVVAGNTVAKKDSVLMAPAAGRANISRSQGCQNHVGIRD